MQQTTQAGVPALVFQNTTFDIVDRSGLPWLQSTQIAEALGYSDPASIPRLYARNADEFTERMTCTVNLTVQGQAREVRIFSLRGAHLIGMLANTAPAKEFRTWLLDVAERAVAANAPGAHDEDEVAYQIIDNMMQHGRMQLQIISSHETQITLLREMLAPRMLAESPQWRKAVRVYGHFGPGKLSHAECAKLMDMGADTWRKLLLKLDALGLIEYRPNPGQSAAGKLARQRDKDRGALSNNASAEHMRKMNEASRVAKARNKTAAAAAAPADDDTKLH